VGDVGSLPDGTASAPQKLLSLFVGAELEIDTEKLPSFIDRQQNLATFSQAAPDGIWLTLISVACVFAVRSTN
jgi:hypothetical protein